jgi:hypothetical protein
MRFAAKPRADADACADAWGVLDWAGMGLLSIEIQPSHRGQGQAGQ